MNTNLYVTIANGKYLIALGDGRTLRVNTLGPIAAALAAIKLGIDRHTIVFHLYA